MFFMIKKKVIYLLYYILDKFGEYLCTKELADCAEPDQTRAQWIHACTTWVSNY